MMTDTRVAIVTGAGREGSIGDAIAQRLATDGFHVFATDIEWSDSTLDDEPCTRADRIESVRCDITCPESICNLFELVSARFGFVNVVVNSARAALGADQAELEDVPLDDWERVIRINLTGSMLMAQSSIALLRRASSPRRIINVSSIHGLRGVHGMAAYSASKFALNGLTQSLALELAPSRISVNAICPGIIDSGRASATEAAQAAAGGLTVDEARELRLREEGRRIPLGRVGSVEEVAHLASYLASPASEYLTGALIPLDGGLSLSVAQR